MCSLKNLGFRCVAWTIDNQDDGPTLVKVAGQGVPDITDLEITDYSSHLVSISRKVIKLIAETVVVLLG